MLICECCGSGFHVKCLKWKQTQAIPKDAWYCDECLNRNKSYKYKDITMDFDVIEYLKGSLDVS